MSRITFEQHEEILMMQILLHLRRIRIELALLDTHKPDENRQSEINRWRSEFAETQERYQTLLEKINSE